MIGFLMISYLRIVAHCMFTTNFSSKRKSQFQVMFRQDSFPLKMSSLQVSISRYSTNCLLPNGCWNTCFHHYSFFTKKFPISFCKRLVFRKIFLFCRTDSFGGLPWLFFRNHWVSNIFFICLQTFAFEYFQYDLIFDISE